MSAASEVLSEEFEVLESIYPTELTRVSDTEALISVEPEDGTPHQSELILQLRLNYPETYPESLPDLSLEVVDGELEEVEEQRLLEGMRSVGEENLGMAMTFTLVSFLRDQVASILTARAELLEHEAMEKERLELEAEEARTKGTPVTVESFKQWKQRFDRQVEIARAREEEERLKGLSPKEREEFKKVAARFTGRQLFERNRELATSDSTLVEEGTVSVDISQYERTAADEQAEHDEDGIHLSDSD
ncbi:RWD-domain-containing protein [Sistotremastrum suecicum HHB10207 ss-3]|uniref:RWD-domain-containing protein n=1 Tax=Sistotremastrum suecicum HHB10207 ss-3 TaxID=1314776 RepID=A0A165Y9G8_9AGAM|nr:RWD-domain-containing protein [Sistotremastrum suecicum HHB10207 ss-3]